MVLMLVVLATATVIEKFYGTETVHQWIYGSVPFVLLWLVIAVTAMAYIVKVKLYRRLPVFLLHVALVVILAGAGTTWLTSSRGKIQLSQRQSVNSYSGEDGKNYVMPFAVSLTDFTIDYYPGTPSPMNFESRISISETDGKSHSAEVSMNHIYAYRGYRFYQTGYDGAGNVILTVAHDPWGIAVTYTGYCLLFIAMIWVLLDKSGSWRKWLGHPLVKPATAVVALLLSTTAAAAPLQQPRVLPAEQARGMGDVLVLYNGRICPLQTLARDFTMKLCGKASYRGMTAEQVLTGWLFYFDDWRSEPMIKVKSSQARALLGIDGRWASMSDFADAGNRYKLDATLEAIMAGKAVEGARGIQETHEKYEIGMMAATGRIFNIFPLNYKGEIRWYAPSSLDVPTDIDESQWAFMRKGLSYLQEQVDFERWDDFDYFVAKLQRYQQRECGAALPSAVQLKAEHIYNSLNYLSPLAMALVTLGILIFVFSGKKWLWWGGVVVLAASLLLLTMVVGLRWVVSGHVPLSNGYETMQFMSWATMAVTLFMLAKRYFGALPYGLLIAGLSLMVATFGESNPAITPLMPVLQSPLLSLHVMVIMLSYSLLAFLCVGGIMALVKRADTEQVERLYVVGQIMLYPAVMLLTIGIFIGAVWANVSWGTYWSWDPKETWALITLIIYSFPLHSRSLKRQSRPLTFHAYMVVAFLSVIITYFGVNFLLGGMHSYA